MAARGDLIDGWHAYIVRLLDQLKQTNKWAESLTMFCDGCRRDCGPMVENGGARQEVVSAKLQTSETSKPKREPQTTRRGRSWDDFIFLPCIMPRPK